MSWINVRALVASVRDARARFNRGAKLAVAEAARTARTTAAAAAPGRAGRTLFLDRRGPDDVRVASNWGKLIFLEAGTKAHRIEPKKAGGRLAFRVNGTWAFARGVNHPGNRAYRFMRRGARAGEARLQVFASGPLF